MVTVPAWYRYSLRRSYPPFHVGKGRHGLKIDFYLPDDHLAEVPHLTARARDIGFDGIFTSDTAHNPFLRLAAAAPFARGLDTGTAVAVAFARSPMVVAQTAWDLSALTQGRFLLGLGTQIRAHIERRFSMPWGAPVRRMAEYISALRAIWDVWQKGGRLRFRGEFYSFTLMTPFFNPGPIDHPDVPVYVAGVGPRMSRLAGQMCDGYHVHPFHTIRYLREVTLPAMQNGAHECGRTLDQIDMASSVFVVTGRDRREMDAMRAGVRQQIAFYASTPAYRHVLDLHGWDFGPKLTALSKRGHWQMMADMIGDEVVSEVAVEAPIDKLGEAVRSRYEGVLDRIGFYNLGVGDFPVTDAEVSRILTSLRSG